MILSIAAVFVALVYLPSLTRKTQFTFPAGDQKTVETFPVDVVLPRVANGKTGNPTTLRELAKQHKGGLIVNFWATWCPPCLEELPSVEYLNRQLASSTDPNLPKLVTISVDETSDVIFSLYRTLDFTPSFLVLHDKTGDTARAVGTSKFPETYWINSEGKILHKWIGPQNWLSGDVLKTLIPFRG